MSVRSDSAASVAALNAYLTQKVDGAFANYGVDAPMRPTAFALWQEIKRLAADVFADHGRHAAFKSFLEDGGFGVETDARKLVASWQGLTEAEAATLTREEASELYEGMVEDEFFDMVGKSEPDGTSIEYEPYREEGGALKYGVVISGPDGDVIASPKGLRYDEADYLYGMLCAQAEGRGSFIPEITGKASEDYESLAAAGEYVIEGKWQIYDYSTGRTGDDSYYARMRAITEKMAGDPAIPLQAIETAKKYTDWYFERSSELYADAKAACDAARECRFPLPAEFEIMGDGRYKAKCDNGMCLRIEQCSEKDYQWFVHPDEGPLNAESFGSAESFENAYVDMYKSSYECFAGIKDPENPLRGSVTLGNLISTPDALKPPTMSQTSQNTPEMPIVAPSALAR